MGCNLGTAATLIAVEMMTLDFILTAVNSQTFTSQMKAVLALCCTRCRDVFSEATLYTLCIVDTGQLVVVESSGASGRSLFIVVCQLPLSDCCRLPSI